MLVIKNQFIFLKRRVVVVIVKCSRDHCITSGFLIGLMKPFNFIYYLRNQKNLDITPKQVVKSARITTISIITKQSNFFQQGINPEEQIAKFFHFTQEIDLSGQSFTDGLRGFLKTFKLPGEAQKIDRLVESFSEAYCEKNPECF